MADLLPERERKTEWVLTHTAFRQLLKWLDGESEAEGHGYMEIRRRLVLYFDRKNCTSPEELADETLNRVARRLEEEGKITTDAPAHYCYIVARFVLLEFLRRQKTVQTLDEEPAAFTQSDEDSHEGERRSEALGHCIQRLDPEDRSLITGYYQGETRSKIENRRKIAASRGLTMNALSIRACRIRDKLEACMRKHLSRI